MLRYASFGFPGLPQRSQGPEDIRLQGCSRFVERGRNRIFNLLTNNRLEVGTRFQTNLLSNQAFAKNQARTEAL